MATFIKPAIKYYHLDYIGECENHPVNIDLCTEIISTEESNGYGKKYPVIKFNGCGATWCYGENKHELRDKQYNEILDKFSP